ncbi:MAG: sigma-70 family RNA polymerase sigma factor [Eubacterium sp.]|nr:sigma-70 family RNA polymerase sigma factor [Eubacterium sp.]
MISENLGLVHSIAHRFTGRGVEYDDLFQSGCVGLIKAVDRFDESKGFAFSTYAVPVIMGEIKRIFRDDGAIKVSRSLKEKAIKAKSVCDSFEKRELRKPTVSELAEMLGISAQETAEVLNVMSPMLSLNSFGEDGENTIDVPVDESEELFNRICIKQLMMHLEETEKRIVDLRYYKGFTQQKTAEILGVSQVQISRKEKKLLQKLRSII